MTTRYFASGSNHPGEIRGLAEAGVNVGVAAPEVGARAVEELEALAGSGTLVFVDSGAFSEVAFGPYRVVDEITPEKWARILDLYEALAAALGPQLYVVAPDRVGDQDVTLERLQTYAPRLRRIAELGANLIVPVQKGARPMAEFFEAATLALGTRSVVAGVPMKKDATTTAELAGFLAAARPARVHLLGLGPESKRWTEVEAAVRETAPTVELLCDSVRIRALVGRSNGPGGAPRVLTAATDEALDLLDYEAFGATEGMDPIDYTDEVLAPESWLTPRLRRDVLVELELPKSVDLDEWLQDDDRYLDPVVEAVINRAWSRLHRDWTVAEKKRRAVAQVFGPATPVPAARAGTQLAFAI